MRHGLASYGKGCRCDVCRAAQSAQTRRYREANLEKVREYRRAYYLANKEAIKAKTAAWQQANPEGVRRHAEAVRNRNREKRREDGRLYMARRRVENPAALAASLRKWRQSDKGRLNKKLRNQAKRGSVIEGDAKDWVAIIQKDPCCYCGGPASEIEHIVPLTKGGSGEWDNLSNACRSCNARKGNKSLLVFLASS